MLSAFTARPIIELKPRDKSKIETILAHGDRVFVGLNTGSLRVYRLNEVPAAQNGTFAPNGTAGPPSTFVGSIQSPLKTTSSDPPISPPANKPQRPTDLLREIEKFSSRAIEQLAIVKEANTIISLSNYHVSLHDLQTYKPIDTLVRTKNATTFAVTSNIVKDAATGIPEIVSRLAVAVKRRLLAWSWHESELSQTVTEVVLGEAVRTVTWASATTLICGMNSGYVLVDVNIGEATEIAAPGAISGSGAGQASRFGAMSTAGMGYMGLGSYMPKPLAAKLADGEMLLAKDINTLFVTDEGKPKDKKQVPWQTAPESIGYSYPYLLALQSPAKGTLEVRNPETLSLLQSMNLQGAAQLYFPSPNLSLAHAGKGFHISSERCVWKMDATDYDSQVEELVAHSRFDEAISILNMLEDALLREKAESMREIKMLKAETLFVDKKYRESLDLFNEDEVRAPPERVLRLFPPMIAGELSAFKQEEYPSTQEKGLQGLEESNEEEEQKENGQQEDQPEARKTSASGSTAQERGGESSKYAEENVDSGSPSKSGGFAKYLIGRKVLPDAVSVTSSRKADTDPDEVASTKGKAAEDHHILEGDDLMNAVLELNSYLVGTRTRLQRFIDPATGRLKAGRAANGEDGKLPSSFAKPNSSDEELERLLCETFRLVDTTLFRAYMYSRPSLAGSLFRIPNFCDPEVVNEKLLEHNRYNELVDFFFGKKLHVQALELLHKFGAAPEPDEAVPTLHGPQRTVLYLQNLPPSELDLILKHAEWTLRANPELGMDVFLADSENAETLPRDRVVKFLGDIDPGLEIQYLEHVITDLDDMTADFHNRLSERFVGRLREMERGDGWDALMVRFLRFLRESSQYSLTRAFGMMPKDDPAFYEAQAVVLSNMKHHKQALEIYVFKMRDYTKAEEYCNRVHMMRGTTSSPTISRPSSAHDPEDPTPSIYHILLSLYLTPPPPHEPALGPALSLLSKHGSRLPAASAMLLIPDSFPVRDLESYFVGRIRTATSIVHEARIVAGLRAAEMATAQARLHLGEGAQYGQAGRARRVVVGDERVCGVCHKRLGGSVVSVLPDGGVLHYGCSGKGTGSLRSPESRRGPSWGRGP